MKESALVRKIIFAVKLAYPLAYVRKLSDRFQRGIPDILIVCNGHVLFVEVKNETGKLSPLQNIEGTEVERAGGRWIVARSAEEVLNALREISR